MMIKLLSKFILIFSIKCGCFVNGFNILSPVPNLSLSPPNSDTTTAEGRSSYFGFTMNLREKSIFIGAPRAQSKLDEKFIETGAIYNCSIEFGQCERFNIENTKNNKLKDGQWLGAAMDGGSNENSSLIVCAPRLQYNEKLLQGACFDISDISKPTEAKIIKKPVSLRKYYRNIELGNSIHLLKEKNDALIGAPNYGNLGKGFVFQKNSNNSDPTFYISSNYSYFGYAVTSIYLKYLNRELYIASAPRYGQVLLFDTLSDGYQVLYYTFFGDQLGEYFGYALETGDFNGDKHLDVAISAPFYAKNGQYENGAVYIYQQRIANKIAFDLKSTLVSDCVKAGGRFGMSVSNIGDINQDGFDDLAIGAPFEYGGTGAVYIYLGGKGGINEKYVQKILPTGNMHSTKYPTTMFGYGISRGMDIDKNHYNDIAISAPNSERVYVYKTYPIVQVKVDIFPAQMYIDRNTTSLNITSCWSLNSSFPLKKEIHINNVITVDARMGRAKFVDDTYRISFNESVGMQKRCLNHPLKITFKSFYVYNPIDIEMNFNVLDTVPYSKKFCENCVAVNPSDSTSATNTIIFRTNCANEKCKVDLKLTSRSLYQDKPFVLGTANEMTFNYTISNGGEIAYYPQVNFTIGNFVKFQTIPKNCKEIDANHLLCNLQQLTKNNPQLVSIVIDVKELKGTALSVKASAFDFVGDEQNVSDNQIEDVIKLVKFSVIDIVGNSNELKMENVQKMEIVTHLYEIKNYGPSRFDKTADIFVSIPSIYRDNSTLKRTEIVPFKGVSIQAHYNNEEYNIKWSHNYTDPLPFEKLLTKSLNNSKLSQYDVADKKDDIISNLPINKTIFFNFTETDLCIQGLVRVPNFVAGDNVPIILTVNFTIDTEAVDQILTEQRNILALSTFATVETDEELINMTITKTFAHTVMYKDLRKTPWLIYCLSLVGGILLLLILTGILYKVGFFKREKKQDLKQLIRRSQMQTPTLSKQADPSDIDDEE